MLKSVDLSIDDFIVSLKSELVRNLPDNFLDKVAVYLNDKNIWEVAIQLGDLLNSNDVSEQQKSFCVQTITKIREFQGEKAKISQSPTKIVFGTSGWRGLIGEDFTYLNVSKVVRAIIDTMKTPTFLAANGYTDFSQVQENGILLFRDNRYLGDEFISLATNELTQAGIKVYNAGLCPTGVGSALVKLLGTAGSINFTPSHNPMQYAGLKFNPADGGPAEKNITTIIEDNCLKYMQTTDYKMADEAVVPEKIAAAEIFNHYLEEDSEVFDIEAIRQWLLEVSQDIKIVIDFMHGAARGYIQQLLGTDVLEQLQSTGSLIFLNTQDDFSFHGAKPEPSAKNQKTLMQHLQKDQRKYNLAVALDPDADRIRFCDAKMDIDMNKFGPMAYLNLLQKGYQGAVATTVASTDLAFEIARKHQQQYFETAVGFKNFRKHLLSEQTIVAFEESDGITVKGHTLEKCAIAGFLSAIDLMMTTSANLSDFYQSMITKYGNFVAGKGSYDVKGLSVTQWQQLCTDFMQYLQNRQFALNDKVQIGEKSLEITQIIEVDGLKILLNDGSWILFRPSGTEPKIKYYYEIVLTDDVAKEAILSNYQQYCEATLKEVLSKLE